MLRACVLMFGMLLSGLSNTIYDHSLWVNPTVIYGHDTSDSRMDEYHQSLEIQKSREDHHDRNMEGWVSQYSPGLMELVIENRIGWNQLPANARDYVAIAVIECNRLGDIHMITWENGDKELAMVTDCSGHTTTTEWMRSADIVLEAEYEAAVRHGFVGQGGIWATLD